MSDYFSVDARLFRIGGRRPEKLTNLDLPFLAKAIVMVLRGLAVASRNTVRDVSYVRIMGESIDFLVRAEEWQLIVPFIQDGTFDPTKYPPPASFPLDPKREYDPGAIDLIDSALYHRVLNVLAPLFPRSFPTSDL